MIMMGRAAAGLHRLVDRVGVCFDVRTMETLPVSAFDEARLADVAPAKSAILALAFWGFVRLLWFGGLTRLRPFLPLRG
jgi:hypothetical protein